MLCGLEELFAESNWAAVVSMKAFMCPSGSGTFQNFLAEPARKAYGWIRMLDVPVQAKSVSCRAVLSTVGAQNGVQTMLNPSMSF